MDSEEISREEIGPTGEARFNINFYLGATLDDTLRQLSAPKSPLVFEKQSDEWYRLRSKSRALQGTFFLRDADDGLMEGIPTEIHQAMQASLGMKPRSYLGYSRCEMGESRRDARKIAAFRGVFDYLRAQGNPVYAIRENMLGFGKSMFEQEQATRS